MTKEEAPRRSPRTGKITSTSVQVRDSNRLSVFVDGSFSFGMPMDAAFDLGIATGVELDQELLDRCLDADEQYRARQRALGLIAHRPRSITELKQRLRMAGFSDGAVGVAMERMQSLGYLDDAVFAQSFARERLGTGRMGSRRVLADLRKKGIDPALAHEAVQDMVAGRDTAQDALGVARKRAAALKSLTDPRKRRQRLYAHLARRGFEAEAIRQALALLEDETGTEAATNT